MLQEQIVHMISGKSRTMYGAQTLLWLHNNINSNSQAAGKECTLIS